MFLELTLYSTDKKILININNINAIYAQEWVKKTNILVGEAVYAVKESYEDILKAINNWDRLTKA